jgi:hypothetical protein
MKVESPRMFDFDFEPEEKPGLWKVQDEPFTILKNRLGRVYAAPPEERLKAFYYTSPTKYEALVRYVRVISTSSPRSNGSSI